MVLYRAYKFVYLVYYHILHMGFATTAKKLVVSRKTML